MNGGGGEQRRRAEAFWSPSSRQGTLPDSELESLLAALETGEHWSAVLDRLDHPVLKRKRDWFIDTAKADFYRRLPAQSRILAVDIGPGSGVIATELAKDYGCVLALERDEGWCTFVRRRFRQDGMRRAWAVRGDALHMPLGDGSADLAVLNGVLEWVPESAPEVTPRVAHLQCLKGIRRALKPGGVLGIAIENRFYYRNFLGYSPHGEPPFSVVLPRAIADWYSWFRRGAPYRTWLYGAGGYRRLLREAGFKDVRVWAALPDYHSPRTFLPLRPGRALLPFFPTRRRVKAAAVRLLALFGLLGRLTHSFYLSGTR